MSDTAENEFPRWPSPNFYNKLREERQLDKDHDFFLQSADNLMVSITNKSDFEICSVCKIHYTKFITSKFT